MKRLLPLLLSLLPLLAGAQTLERIRASQQVSIGYQADLAPFSSTLDGQARGYAIELCQQVVEQVRREQGLAQVQPHFQAMDVTDGLAAVQAGKLDLFCGATAETLERRRQVSFSVPIYAAGRGVAVRRDAPESLVRALNGEVQASAPQWRANISRVLASHRFLVLEGSTGERW
ncbi:MAG TPA: transporter substrate-binding domain-containing protein, partial [Pseudomonas sp.]|nr:transporter substrate-binding domain-containing protein [Pseudomonas sp.]